MHDDWGKGDYAVLIDGVVHRYDHWDAIPARFDRLIKWVPDIPPGPHTAEQHAQIERLPEIMRDVMARERGHAGSDADR